MKGHAAAKPFSHQTFILLCGQDPEACWQAYCALLQQVAAQEGKEKELQGRLKQDSSNSHRPPSADYAKRLRNNSRERSGRKPGGQPGHRGCTLRQVPDPDRTVVLVPKTCSCGHHFEGGQTPVKLDRRQVFDLPPPRLEVTEYQAATLTCPNCGAPNRGIFPEGVDAPVKYGPLIRGIVVNLNVYNYVPFARGAELFRDVFGVPLSPGSMANILADAAGNAKPIVEEIKSAIQAAEVAHFDETGSRSEGRREWLHVAATEQLTVYFHHQKRGVAAMDELGILPSFTGYAIHDHWAPYYTFTKSTHRQCCTHLLRDTQGVHDTFGLQWPLEMKRHLKDAKANVDAAKATGKTALSESELEAINQRYQAILRDGRAETPPPPPRASGKRGGHKRGKAISLLDRLGKNPEQVLGFTTDFRVPFGNNLAERDIRMAKLKQKVSGGFRSKPGAENFCLIRSVISTTVKQTGKVMNAVAALVKGVAPALRI